MTGNDEVPRPYYQSVPLDGPKTFNPKTRLKRWQQYNQLASQIEIKPMLTRTPIKEQKDLKNKKKNGENFLRSLGRNVLHKKTKEFEGKNTEKKILQLITVSAKFCRVSRKTYQSHGDFFWGKPEQKEALKQHCHKLNELQKTATPKI